MMFDVRNWFPGRPPPSERSPNPREVRRDRGGQPQGSDPAPPVEPPAAPLQGEPLPGGGAADQPEGEPDAVLQAEEAGELPEPR